MNIDESNEANSNNSLKACQIDLTAATEEVITPDDNEVEHERCSFGELST